MCFGGDDGSDEAKRARRAEEARQARIREGTTRINSLFDGGTIATGQVGAGGVFDPNEDYFNPDGSAWAPTPQTAGRRGRLSGPTAAAQFGDLVKSGKLFSDLHTSTGFNDAFFKGRRDAYTNYATPQLEDQFGKTQRELIFSLDRSGNLDSSARADKMSELTKLYDIQKQNVADKALSYETTARNSTEDARANLIATLNATGDAEGAAKSAIARSQALSAPTEYSPLGQLFTDFTAGLGVQAAQERSFAAGGPKPAYNTGLFSNRGRTTVSG